MSVPQKHKQKAEMEETNMAEDDNGKYTFKSRSVAEGVPMMITCSIASPSIGTH